MNEMCMWVSLVVVFMVLLQVVSTYTATLSSFIGLICSLLGVFTSLRKDY